MISEDAVLNPQLYRALCTLFGTVKVEKRGQPLVRKIVDSADGLRTDILEGGETYRVCHGGDKGYGGCGDTKFHLYVNHAFGMTDPDTGRKIFLATCYRCGSVAKWLNEQIGSIWSTFRSKNLMRTAPSKVEEDGYVDPGVIRPLSDRSGFCDAGRNYLIGRGLDPDYLSQMYGWGFCVKGTDLWYGAGTGRLFIPVTRDGKAVGWQYRLAFDPPPEKKDKTMANLRWLTMPGAGWRSKNLVGYDQAKPYDFCILVEGPTDMARQGPPCVGSLGMTMSFSQYELIAQTWGHKQAIIVVGDAGENEDRVVQRTCRGLLEQPDCKCPVYAPRLEKGDPGSMDRTEFFAFIKRHIDEHPRGVAEQDVATTGRPAASTQYGIF